MKIPMREGENHIQFARRFQDEPPEIHWVGSGRNAYLWIGGEKGPCYATCSRPKALVNLAKRILKDYKAAAK